MGPGAQILTLLFVAALPFTHPAAGSDLKFITTNSKMLRGVRGHSVVYDGDSSLYTIGGLDDRTGGSLFYESRIAKYSTADDSLGVYGEFHHTAVGAAVMHGDDIIYFGGFNGTHKDGIYRYSTTHRNYTIENNLPVRLSHMAVAWDPTGQLVYTFGGNHDMSRFNYILKYSPSTNELEHVANLTDARYQSRAVWGRDGLAYIFGGYMAVSLGGERDIFAYDPSTQAVTKLATALPDGVREGCAVLANDGNAYIIGDWERSLIKFNPTSGGAELIPVDGWPNMMEKPSCAFVPKLGRMYILGGYGRMNSDESFGYLDHISYIQLNNEDISTTTEEPSTTTESWIATTESPFCPSTGVHTFPYPGNCTLYIKCFDGFEQILSCYPLIFDKIDLVCKPETEAVCDEEEPPNGCPAEGYASIPHPSNCSKYYECFNGNRYESECANNTYFDANPDILRCNHASIALCNSECPQTGVEFQPIRETGCKFYKVCLEGVSTNLECGDGQLYSPVESKCVGLDAYTCPYTFMSL